MYTDGITYIGDDAEYTRRERERDRVEAMRFMQRLAHSSLITVNAHVSYLQCAINIGTRYRHRRPLECLFCMISVLNPKIPIQFRSLFAYY